MGSGGYMKLHEVLYVCNQKRVMDIYSDYYDVPYLKAYYFIKGVLKELSTVELDENYDEGFAIMINKSEFEDTYDVFGWDCITREAFAMDYSPWEDWINTKVDDSVFNEISVDEIVAHCIFEMTLNGKTNEAVKEKAKEVEALFEKISTGDTEVVSVDISELLNLDEALELADGDVMILQIPDKKSKLN